MAHVYKFTEADCAGFYRRKVLQREIRAVELSVGLKGIRRRKNGGLKAIFDGDLTAADLTALQGVIAAHGETPNVDPIESEGIPVQIWFHGGKFYAKRLDNGVIRQITTKAVQ